MISFCHYGSPRMASYRYRCLIPAHELGATINDPSADVLVFCKPHEQDARYVQLAKGDGRAVVVDICDLHMELPHYEYMVRAADVVTCPTQWMADYLRDDYGVEAVIVPDPYEYPELTPHCNGANLLWFGHGSNADSLLRVMPTLGDYSLKVVSNFEGAIPWSLENLEREPGAADIVIMPETAPYKSGNRTIEAIRSGCFVVAEPHPAINAISGIWIGNIKKGIEWAQQNLRAANSRTQMAQEFIKNTYSPQTQANAWRTAIQKALSSSTSVVEISTGTDG